MSTAKLHNEIGYIRCPTCGDQNRSYAQFCVTCGESTDSDSAAIQVASLGMEPSRSLRKPAVRGALLPWEALLGALLLVATLGYALYNWQTSEARSAAYRAGISAEQKNDWDEAYSRFAAAGDQIGAAEKAQAANAHIRERNRLYSGALSALETHDWKATAAGFGGVEAIQPGYRDTTRLLAQSKAAAFQQGVGGIAYLVSGKGAQQPGLYRRDAQGHTRQFPNSDRHSQVRAASPDGLRFVYDLPGDEAGCPPTSPGNSTSQQTPCNKSGRVPVEVEIGAEGIMTVAALPWLDGEGTGVFSADGLWWYNSKPGAGSFASDVFYSSRATQPRTVTQVSDVASGKRVLALDPPRARVVLAQVSIEAGTGAVQTRLYLAGAAGEAPQLLASAPDAVYSASVSRDGSRLLYITQRNADDITRTVWTMEIGAGTGERPPPRKLDSVTWRGIEASTSLNAAFVPASYQQSFVAVSSADARGAMLSLYDQAGTAPYPVWHSNSPGALRRDMAAFSHSGLMLAWRSQGAADSLIKAYLPGVTPKPAELSTPSLALEPPKSISIHATDSQRVLLQFAPLDNYLVATVQNQDGVNRGHTQAVYVAKCRDTAARLLAVADMPYEAGMPTVAMPADGSLLMYINGTQELHAAAYDGSGDTLVARGVRAVWSASDPDLLWWR